MRERKERKKRTKNGKERDNGREEKAMKEKYNTELADMEGPWSWQWMCQKKVAEEQFRHI